MTDGRGSYAMGTVAGALTRSYHGLLVAALKPPVGRTVAVATVAEGVTTPRGRRVHLHTQEWADGTIDPQGYLHLEAFSLDDGMPVFEYAVDGLLLEKRLWMAREGATWVVYRLLRSPGDAAVDLELRPLCTWRDHHAVAVDGSPSVEAVDDPATPRGVVVRFQPGPATTILGSGGDVEPTSIWYVGARLRAESERGLPDIEDLLCPMTLRARLGVGDALALVAQVGDPPRAPDPRGWAVALEAERRRVRGLRALAAGAGTTEEAGEPPWVGELVVTADRFLVARGAGRSVVAGYPWFTDWSRDTCISLPGLTLVTGRPEISREILRSLAEHLDRGLLPTTFPEPGTEPERTAADASLWFVEALRAHVAATGDEDLVGDLWPALEEIVGAYAAGTDWGIGVDPNDGLLRAGAAGLALTWMDARIDGFVVTPRAGKAIDLCALWANAVTVVGDWAAARGLPLADRCRSLADLAARGFARFWEGRRAYPFDVLDGPEGRDGAVRPNAVIAASLPRVPMTSEQRTAILVEAERSLVTSLGLRSLAPDDPAYQPRYTGDRVARDVAYHQGTVWAWLFGPFVAAELAVRRAADPGGSTDPAGAARRWLLPVGDHLADAGLGGVSEIADGDPPHTPRGCPWQAWSVAEVLRAWRSCDTAGATGPSLRRSRRGEGASTVATAGAGRDAAGGDEPRGTGGRGGRRPRGSGPRHRR